MEYSLYSFFTTPGISFFFFSFVSVGDLTSGSFFVLCLQRSRGASRSVSWKRRPQVAAGFVADVCAETTGVCVRASARVL